MPSKPPSQPALAKPSRRGVQAKAAGLLALGAVQPAHAETPTAAAPGANPDAEPIAASCPDALLIAACAEHAANNDALNRASDCFDECNDPLWAAYDRTRDAISEAEPQSKEGVLAKARAAKGEAIIWKDAEDPTGTVAADWAWDVVNDLMRLYGRA